MISKLENMSILLTCAEKNTSFLFSFLTSLTVTATFLDMFYIMNFNKLIMVFRIFISFKKRDMEIGIMLAFCYNLLQGLSVDFSVKASDVQQ